MRLRHVVFSLLAATAFLAAHGAGAAPAPPTARAPLGQVQLTLPIPAEFEPPSVTPKAYMRFFEEAQPPANRVLAAMLSKDYVAKVRAGNKTAEMSRYLVVKTLRRFDQEDFTPDDLTQAKAMMRHPSAQVLQLQRDLLTQAANRMAKDVSTMTGDASVTMHSGEVHALGVFDEQPNSIAVAALQTSGSHSKAGTEEYVQVAATALILVRHKMLSVVVYDDFDSPANVEWVKGVIRDYVKRVDELNP